ncbi:MAG TPA: (2Fe-2S)-binding protein [Pirellulales bacterium]|nr:(2Fe-2S)-binding protein [Pirellulales bacterium]
MKDFPHAEQAERPDSAFSRRAFLRGSGAAAAATALATGPVEAAEEKQPKIASGQGTSKIKLIVNGKSQEVEVETRATLLDVLRYQLDLTGAKPVSIDETSGACTVLLDGKPISANTKLAMQCEGKRIQTVESLGGEKPDAVPLAFVKHDAMQCGFCTPGFVVAVRTFLDKNPKATEAEIRQGLNGNICRCGTYANVIQAVIDVVKGGKK